MSGEDSENLSTKLDCDYAHGQLKLENKTRNLGMFTVTGGDFTGNYRFLKGSYGLADFPTIFRERINKTLEYKHAASLDDIIKVTKADVKENAVEVREAVRKCRI